MMGIDPDHLSAVPSITLGTSDVSPLEMASAYQTLANEGRHCAPFAISRVELASEDGPDALLYRHRDDCHQVIDRDIAAQVTSMLQGVVTLPGATGTGAAIGRPVAGKTGHDPGVLERVVRGLHPAGRPRPCGSGSPGTPTRWTTTSGSPSSAARSPRRSGART